MNMQSTDIGKSVLVLGATGSFGSRLVSRLAATGWQVRGLARKAEQPQTDNVQWVVGDIKDLTVLADAASEVDVIVHAVNVPYPKWDPLMIQYTKAIIDVAIANQAHLLFVGNIYNAGIPENGIIDATTPDNPINEKGQIRATLEGMISKASSRGLRSTIMRFGDFFGPDIKGPNWFKELTKNVHKNKLTFAGDPELKHTWAYLPDAVKACEEVLSIRIADTTLAPHMVLPFEGHVFSFTQLQNVIESALHAAGKGTQLKIDGLPWTLFRTLGYVIPLMRDIVSMRYLWNYEIRMDGDSVASLLGGAPTHTPLDQAVLNSVSALSEARQQTAIERSA